MLSLAASSQLAAARPRPARGGRGCPPPCSAVLGRNPGSVGRVNRQSGVNRQGRRDFDEALEAALDNYFSKERPNEDRRVGTERPREDRSVPAEASPFTDVTDRVPSGDGWTFEAVVPGLSSDDVHIDLSPSEGKVHVHGVDERLHRRFAMATPIPEGADWQGIHATCKDGLLTIHVPRERPPQPPPTTPAPQDVGMPGTGEQAVGSLQHFALDVPGLRAADILVEVDKAEGFLHITGKSAVDSRFDIDKRFKVSPNVDSEHIVGSCSDGVLHLALPLVAPRRVALHVTSTPPNEEDDSYLFVYHAAAPGIQAKDLTAVVAGDHLLLQGIRHGAGPSGSPAELRRKIPFPFPVPHPEEIHVSLADGLINVAVPPAALGRAGEQLAVHHNDHHADEGQAPAGAPVRPVGGVGGSPGGPGGRRMRLNKLGKL